jgi:hypothetical protein
MPEYRLLTVGCFDAAIELWVAQQINGTAHLRIDGIDLSRDALRRARDRMGKAGLPGEFKWGAALDAPRLFEPGTFDGIVVFELIEHVPDMTEFLDTMECMVKPSGRVFVSTPDGTWGLGSNPHHLRALRAVDLADILRRRGELADMIVGNDGVSVASYVPKPRRGDVALFLGACWAPWSPWDAGTKGLGGSETAAVRLAEGLSQMGFVVTVFGDVPEMAVRQVLYRHHSVFDPLETRGALICSRIPEVGDRPIAAKTKMLWLHDADAGDRLTPERVATFDYVLCLSRWHERHLRGLYPFLDEKLVRTRNGIYLPLFEVVD